jgi:hypothetical protein
MSPTADGRAHADALALDTVCEGVSGVSLRFRGGGAVELKPSKRLGSRVDCDPVLLGGGGEVAGTLFVVNKTDERLVFDPDRQLFEAEAAVGNGHAAIIFKPKTKPKPPPPVEPEKTKGTLPPKPIDIDISFVAGPSDERQREQLWSSATNVATLRGAINLDHLKTWARDIPEGEHHVLVLEAADGG